MESSTMMFNPYILNQLNKKPEDVSGIQWIAGCSTIQIDFNGGDRLWIEAELKNSEKSITSVIKTHFRPFNEFAPGMSPKN